MTQIKSSYSDLSMGKLIFGGNVFGWTLNEQESFTILDAFVDAGFNTIDTADSYAHWVPGNKGGESEAIIGKWIKARSNRSQVIIATKVGSGKGKGKNDLSRAHIVRSVEESLTRLQTDYIDLYQSHWDDLDTPVDETLEIYNELVQAGKVRWIGASNLSPERLSESIDVSKTKRYPVYRTLQPEYNLYDREKFETQYQKISVANGLSVIPYYSLASGFLTGKYRSENDLGAGARAGAVKKYLNDRGYRILAALDEVAMEHETKPASVALAWLSAQPGVSAPIASATTADQLRDLIAATNLRLSQADLDKLTRASAYNYLQINR